MNYTVEREPSSQVAESNVNIDNHTCAPRDSPSSSSGWFCLPVKLLPEGSFSAMCLGAFFREKSSTFWLNLSACFLMKLSLSCRKKRNQSIAFRFIAFGSICESFEADQNVGSSLLGQRRVLSVMLFEWGHSQCVTS